MALKRFAVDDDDYFLTNIEGYFVLALYEVQSTGARYVAIGRLNQNGITSPRTGLIEENVSFDTHGWVDYVPGS